MIKIEWNLALNNPRRLIGHKIHTHNLVSTTQKSKSCLVFKNLAAKFMHSKYF